MVDRGPAQRRLPAGDPGPRPWRRVAGADHPDPLAISASFPSSPAPGPVEIDVEVVRRGRAFTVVRARMTQDGVPQLDAVATCGRLPETAETLYDGTRPDAAADRGLLPAADRGTGFRGAADERRPRAARPGGPGLGPRRSPAGEPEIRGYLSLMDGREPDPLLAGAGRRCRAAADLQPRHPRLGADAAAQRVGAPAAGARAARRPQPARAWSTTTAGGHRLHRRDLRGVGQHGRAGRHRQPAAPASGRRPDWPAFLRRRSRRSPARASSGGRSAGPGRRSRRTARPAPIARSTSAKTAAAGAGSPAPTRICSSSATLTLRLTISRPLSRLSSAASSAKVKPGSPPSS